MTGRSLPEKTESLPNARPLRSRLLGVLAVAAVALMAACGGDPLMSESDRNLAARMSDLLPLGSQAVPVTADESNCLSKRAVSQIGSDRLESEYGVTRETIAEGRSPWDVAFSPGDATVLVNATFDCIDWDRFLTDRLLREGLGATQAACAAGLVDIGLLRDQAQAAYQGIDAPAALEQAIDNDFSRAKDAC